MNSPKLSQLEKSYPRYGRNRPVRRLASVITSAVQLSLWILKTIRPSLGFGSEDSGQKLRKTAYLDGMRGFAALMVYWTHHELWANDTTADGVIGHVFENSFGYKGHYAFVAFPFIRILFSGGHYAVAVFFVISGYALSWKPMVLVHSGDYAQLLASISPGLFKRGLRLWIPHIIITFLYMISFWIFDIDAFPDRAPSFGAEWFRWYKEATDHTYIFRCAAMPVPLYNVFAWTMLVEFRGSIIVYITIIALARFTTNARLLSINFLIWYFMYIVDGWSCALFLAGMLLCDLDLLAEYGRLPRIFDRFKPFSSRIFYTLAVVSVWTGGMPYHSPDITELRKQWGWYYLSFLKPTPMTDYKWFFMFWAAVTIVVATPRVPWLKTFFESRFCQYLGRVSFAFYLLHGPILWTIGNRLYVAVGFARDMHEVQLYGWLNEFTLPQIGLLGLDPAFLATQVILLPLTLWLAEIGTKLIDEPSVRLPQRLYELCLRPPIQI